MSKIAIDELFHELGTIEQKTYRGGKLGNLPFLTLSKSGSTGLIMQPT
jgi:hypothetical protein